MVFLVGAHDGCLPLVGSTERQENGLFEHPARLREEQRLAYVACTRAQERLIVTFCLSPSFERVDRGLRGEREPGFADCKDEDINMIGFPPSNAPVSIIPSATAVTTMASTSFASSNSSGGGGGSSFRERQRSVVKSIFFTEFGVRLSRFFHAISAPSVHAVSLAMPVMLLVKLRARSGGPSSKSGRRVSNASASTYEDVEDAMD